MVASDQNQVFDTGDPSGHPTPVFDQQRQAELVKMQDFLLSQKREEIFGKKRKKKDKKHENHDKKKPTKKPCIIMKISALEDISNSPKYKITNYIKYLNEENIENDPRISKV